MAPNRRRNEPRIIIRAPERSDFKDIVDTYYSYYTEVKSNPSLGLGLFRKKPTIKEEIKWFNNLLKNVSDNSAVASIAEVNGKVVGLCDIRSYPIVEKRHIGRLGIAIRQEYRSSGIGTMLMKHAIGKAKGSYRILDLEVFGTNLPAIRLYHKLGFKKYGSLPEGYIRGKMRTECVLMYLKL